MNSFHKFVYESLNLLIYLFVNWRWSPNADACHHFWNPFWEPFWETYSGTSFPGSRKNMPGIDLALVKDTWQSAGWVGKSIGKSTKN